MLKSDRRETQISPELLGALLPGGSPTPRFCRRTAVVCLPDADDVDRADPSDVSPRSTSRCAPGGLQGSRTGGPLARPSGSRTRCVRGYGASGYSLHSHNGVIFPPANYFRFPAGGDIPLRKFAFVKRTYLLPQSGCLSMCSMCVMESTCPNCEADEQPARTAVLHAAITCSTESTLKSLREIVCRPVKPVTRRIARPDPPRRFGCIGRRSKRHPARQRSRRVGRSIAHRRWGLT